MDASEARKHRKLPWKQLVIVAVVGLLLAAAMAGVVDLPALHRRAESLPGWLLVLLLCVLPLVGVPATLLDVVAGARFGTVWGLVWTAVAIAVNLLGTWWITHSFLHDRVHAFFDRRGYPLPRVTHGDAFAVALFVSLLPGVPFTAKNYLLALAGIRFSIYFWVSWPVNLVHGSIGILFGDFTDNLTPGRIAFLGVYALVLFLAGKRVVSGYSRRVEWDSRPQPGNTGRN